MDEHANALMLEFLSWISSRRRSYGETMKAWRTSCPRQSVWEEGKSQEVVLTARGKALLNGALSAAR